MDAFGRQLTESRQVTHRVLPPFDTCLVSEGLNPDESLLKACNKTTEVPH